MPYLSPAEKTRRAEQRIEHYVRDMIEEIITEDEGRETLKNLIKTNPTVLTQYLPKVKDTDADLKQSHLSLLSSYEHLPKIEDLTEKIRVLELELRRIHLELEHERAYNHKVVLELRKLKGISPKHQQIAKDFHEIIRKLNHGYARLLWEKGELILDMDKAASWLKRILDAWEPDMTELERWDRDAGNDFDDLKSHYGRRRAEKRGLAAARERNKALREAGLPVPKSYRDRKLEAFEKKLQDESRPET